jgi:hypothetical protein
MTLTSGSWPGHMPRWQLTGSNCHWVPPATSPRRRRDACVVACIGDADFRFPGTISRARSNQSIWTNRMVASPLSRGHRSVAGDHHLRRCAVADGVRLHPLGTPKGRYDEHSSKSSLSCETKVYRTSRRKPNFRRWCLLASRQLQTIYKAPRLGLCFAPAATWNLHTTQPRILIPTYDEVVNLTGLL